MNELIAQSTNLTATILASESNTTHLSQINNLHIADPMSSSTMGLMMLLSTLQYQAPYMDPRYSYAASQAGKAAFIESGGQALQDRFIAMTNKKATDMGKNAIRYIGVSEVQLGIVLGTYKVYKARQIDIKGPTLHSINTNLTLGTDHGSIGLGWNFK